MITTDECLSETWFLQIACCLRHYDLLRLKTKTEDLNLYTYKIKVTKVIDGDSIRGDISLGLNLWLHDQDCRLFAIDTPETKAFGGDQEMKRWGLTVSKWVQDRVKVGEEYVIKTFKDNRGKFGRPMIKLYHQGKNKRCLNDVLCLEGLAVPYYGQSKSLVLDLHRKNLKKFVDNGGELVDVNWKPLKSGLLKRSKQV